MAWRKDIEPGIDDSFDPDECALVLFARNAPTEGKPDRMEIGIALDEDLDPATALSILLQGVEKIGDQLGIKIAMGTPEAMVSRFGDPRTVNPFGISVDPRAGGDNRKRS